MFGFGKKKAAQEFAIASAKRQLEETQRRLDYCEKQLEFTKAKEKIEMLCENAIFIDDHPLRYFRAFTIGDDGIKLTRDFLQSNGFISTLRTREMPLPKCEAIALRDFLIKVYPPDAQEGDGQPCPDQSAK